MDYVKEFKINGTISTENFILTEDDLSDLFMQWCEDNNLFFAGSFYKNN